MNLEPARSVIEKLGGIDVVAQTTGKHVSRIYRWMYSKERGGTGGFIPQSHIPDLLAYARDHGINLTANDFFATSPAPDPAETLPAREDAS